MNILCLDSPLAGALKALGHTVLDLSPEPGLVSLDWLLGKHGFAPDLLIQHERLGNRALISDLAAAPCPTVFISVDAHLNLFWQRHYARLFDVTATPHVSLFNTLPAQERNYTPLRFNHLGADRPWRTHAARQHQLGLCGRLNEHRKIRLWLSELLQKRCGLHLESDLPFAAMLDFYSDTRIIPNESIAYEVNFRLFEGASCGCLTLNQDIGADQDSAFEPGREMLVYRDGLELLEQIAYYSKHQDQAERIGLAGWKRVQAEHLPARRAQTLADLATAPRARLAGQEAETALWLALAMLARHGSHPWALDWLLKRALAIPPSPAVVSAKIALLAEASGPDSHLRGQGAFAPDFLREQARVLCLQGLLEQEDQGLRNYAAASGCALFLGDFRLALKLWQRGLFFQPAAAARSAPAPETPYELCLLWAESLKKEEQSRPGFKFTPETNIPECAYEFLLLAATLAPGKDVRWVKQIQALSAARPGYTVFSHGFLAELCLAEPQNWRYQLDYGLLNLKVCRVEEGLFEVREAGLKAAKAGRSALFRNILAASPSGRRIAQALNLATL